MGTAILSEPHRAWLEIAARLGRGEPAKGARCPNCGDENVDHRYVGDPVSRVGYLAAWCPVCLHGIHISRVRIPERETPIAYSDLERIAAEIADFLEVEPD
jgi:hypothetical protein